MAITLAGARLARSLCGSIVAGAGSLSLCSALVKGSRGLSTGARGPMQGVETIIERQQRMLAEGDGDCFFLGSQHGRTRLRSPSSTESRFFYLATVFGSRPCRSSNFLAVAFDRCIAARAACVVVALP